MTKTLSSSRVGAAVVAILLTWLVWLVLDVQGSPAQAAPKAKVGVSITGSPASHVREAIHEVLKHHHFEVVSTDLGGGSDGEITAAAKQAGLAAVVVGEVRDGGKRLKLRVYGPAGDLIGESSWAEAGAPKKLGSAVHRTLWKRVGGSLAKARGAVAGAEKGEKDEKDENEDSEKDETSEEAEPKEGEPAPTYSRSKDSDSARNGGEGDDEGSHKKRKHRAATEEAKAEPDADEGGGAAAGRALELGVGPRLLWRNLAWTNDTSGKLRPYSVGHAPSLGVSLAWYPAAHVTGGWVSNLGLAASFEYTPGLASQTQNGASFPTSASDLWLGARGRLLFGPVEGALTLGGGQQSFIFHSQGTSDRGTTLADLPDVKYTYARVGLDLRFALPANVSVLLGGGFRYVLGAGNVNYLLETAMYFPNASIAGFEGMAGLGYRFLAVLEARAGFDLRRYQITAGTNPYGASGATDQYVAGWLQLVFVLDGASGAGSKTHTSPDEAPASKAEKAPEKSKGGDDAE